MIRLLLIFAISLAACSDHADSMERANLNEATHRYKQKRHKYDWIFFHRITVVDYVELLKFEERGIYTIYRLTTGNRAKSDWIKESDLNYLMTLIESKRRAKCVKESISSDWKPGSDDFSTLGGQVMNIIDSYRKNEPYPNFFVDCSITDSTRVQEIKKWWEERSKQ